MAYLYNYVGKPEKTTEKVHYILDNFYKNTPDGLIGNEDCGQMSAWYVLSSMGVYQVTPGLHEWQFTKPIFKQVKINLENGESIIMDDSDNYKFLSEFSRKIKNNETYALPEISYGVPVIEAKSKSFKDKLKVEIITQNPQDKIYCTILNANQTDDNNNFFPYLSALNISESSRVVAFSKNKNGEISNKVSATFFKKPNNYTINIKSTYNPQYHAGGPDGLLDGIFGTTNWRKGDWQGYQSQDFEATVDLQGIKLISEICSNYLQDQRSWILMPTKVEYFTSIDNINFTLVATIDNDINPKKEDNSIKDFKFISNPINARYVKVKAYNFGKLPEWHQGFGGDAFIFIDEITIK